MHIPSHILNCFTGDGHLGGLKYRGDKYKIYFKPRSGHFEIKYLNILKNNINCLSLELL